MTYKYKKKKVKCIIEEESKIPLGIVSPSSSKALNKADVRLNYGIINQNKILNTCLRAKKIKARKIKKPFKVRSTPIPSVF